VNRAGNHDREVKVRFDESVHTDAFRTDFRVSQAQVLREKLVREQADFTCLARPGVIRHISQALCGLTGCAGQQSEVDP
jgi:hypothetical protein